MPKPWIVLHGRTRNGEQVCKAVPGTFTERILGAQRVIRLQMEKRDIAESVLLRVCANWERFVDEHLIDCVNRDPSGLSGFLGVAVPAHLSRDLCEGLLFGGSYRDFKSLYINRIHNIPQ